MKKIIFSLVVIACLLTLGVGNAFAANIGESSLAEYIANHEPGAQLVPADTAMKRVETPQYQASCEVHGIDELINGNPIWSLGWYKASTTAPFTANIQEAITSNLFHSYASIGPFKPEDNPFGLYLYDGTKYYYTQQSLNPDGVNVKAYQVKQANDHRWIIGFDFDPTDDTENIDIVIWVQPVESATIPEFPTVAMPIAAILGLMFIFGRKKQE